MSRVLYEAFYEQGVDTYDLGDEVALAVGRVGLVGAGNPLDDERYRTASAGFGESGEPQVLLINGMSIELIGLDGRSLLACPFRDVKRFTRRDTRIIDLWVLHPPESTRGLVKYIHKTVDRNAGSVESQWCHARSVPHLGQQLPLIDFRLEPYVYFLGRVVDATARLEVNVAMILESFPGSTGGNPEGYFVGRSGNDLWNGLDKLAVDNSGFNRLAYRCRGIWEDRKQLVHGTFIPSGDGSPSRVVRKFVPPWQRKEASVRYVDQSADLPKMAAVTYRIERLIQDCFRVTIQTGSRPLERIEVPDSGPPSEN